MRLAHRLLVLLVLSVALAAVPAPAAADPVHVYAEVTGDEGCPAVSASGPDANGGCLLHAASADEVVFKAHVAGVESVIATCDSEFHARVEADGDGYIFEHVLTGSGCNRQPCAVSGEAQPWGLDLTESSGAETVAVSLCVEPLGGGADETCIVPMPMEPVAGEHSYVLGQDTEMPAGVGSGFQCEVLGEWETEVGGTLDGDPELEVMPNLQYFGLSSAGPPALSMTGNSSYGEQAGLIWKVPTKVVITASGVTITCNVSWMKGTVKNNGDFTGGNFFTQFEVQWVLMEGCSDGSANPVYIRAALPWLLSWTAVNTFRLYNLAFQAEITSMPPKVCTFTLGANAFNMTWSSATTPSQLVAAAAPLSVAGGCTGPASMSATYKVLSTSKPGVSNLWLYR